MKGTRRKYDDEFKRSAVKLVVDQERSLSEVAKNLGVHENILHRWKREYLEDPVNAFPGIGHLKPEDEEMRKLKKQLRDTTEERDILKKAIAIFSRIQK